MKMTADTPATCEDCGTTSNLVDCDLSGCLNTLCRPCAKRHIDQMPGLSCLVCKWDVGPFVSCEACCQDFCTIHAEHECSAIEAGETFVGSVGPVPVTIESPYTHCHRCGCDLHRGYCTDATCPYSDRPQCESYTEG